MLRKSLKLPAGLLVSIALTLTGSLMTTSAIAAKPADPTPASTTSTPKAPTSSAALMEALKLTDQQKNDIRVIRSNRTKQINQILDADQKAKFEQARKAGKPLGEALKTLSLKPAQKTQILAIVKASADNIKAKLNPAQLKVLNDYMKRNQAVGAAAVE